MASGSDEGVSLCTVADGGSDLTVVKFCPGDCDICDDDCHSPSEMSTVVCKCSYSLRAGCDECDGSVCSLLVSSVESSMVSDVTYGSIDVEVGWLRSADYLS